MTDSTEFWDTTTEGSANLLDGFRLDGKVGVVTGAGRGIGRGIALGLADAGADVVLTARRRHELASLPVVEVGSSRVRRDVEIPFVHGLIVKP